MKNPNKKEKNNRSSLLGYFVGSAILCVVATTVLPEFMSMISGSINKYSIKKTNSRREDDWGPVIVRKNKRW